MKAEHTPGPWRLREYSKSTHYNKHERFAQIESESGEYWIVDALRLDCKHGMADARLIAAAPEMLHALQAVLELREPCNLSPEDGHERFENLMLLAEKAISKAKAA